MTNKEKIQYIIDNEPIVKQAYETSGAFHNIIMPLIKDSTDDSILYDLITMLALQCTLYDTVLSNISLLGTKELVNKCSDDIDIIMKSLNSMEES